MYTCTFEILRTDTQKVWFYGEFLQQLFKLKNPFFKTKIHVYINRTRSILNDKTQ